jgi:glutaredoxin
MKYMTWRLILWLIPALLASSPGFSQDIIIYTKTGCPFCQQATEFLEDAKQQHPGFQFEERNITGDPETMAAFLALIEQYEIERPAVPLMLAGDQVFVGFRIDETPQMLAEVLGWYDQGIPLEEQGPGIQERRLPAWLSLERYGLPAFTVIIGVMDGFNPCATWVLMFLLSMLVHVKSRKRMFLIAGIFVLISGVVYFLFMAAWLKFLLAFRLSVTIRIVIGVLGLTAAGFHLKDYFMNLRGPSLSISQKSKSNIGAKIRSVITAKNLPAALLTVSVLAILVNFYELLCTAGLPAIYTQVLVNQDIEGGRFYAYLLLYNAAYILDDSVMVFAATWALSSKRLKPGAGRVLKGLSGLVLLVLSLLLIFKPEWLSFTP